ncbi:MFS transporter [candidate division KSB1 bacterium]|nr:MFS transporter [candidate division KSB1 bacterium]
MPPQKNDRRTIFAWTLYDFANSSFSTLVLTFIYATYFTKTVAPDEISGTAMWSRGITISALTVGLLSPFFGALADNGGFRKRILLILTAITVIGTANLFNVLPGQVLKGLVWFVIANIGMEMGMVFYNAFLPDVAPSDKIGRISGYGWGVGYIGGLLCMVVAMVGFVQTENPWFGFSTENSENIRATNLLVAVWFTIFAVPFFIWVKEKKGRTFPNIGQMVSSTVGQLKSTFHEIKRYRQIVRLLIARIFYNDGIITIASFGGIYAAGTFGFTFSEILTFGIVLNITAGLGAFAMGFLDDRIGGKRTIQITNMVFIAATLLAVFAPSKLWFWVSGIIVGFFLGPNQAVSRSLMGRFVPSDKETEFFGFYAFSGKATAFIGPFFLGILTEMFNSQRAGMSIVVVMFIVGSLLLTRVDEEEGKRLSGRS